MSWHSGERLENSIIDRFFSSPDKVDGDPRGKEWKPEWKQISCGNIYTLEYYGTFKHRWIVIEAWTGEKEFPEYQRYIPSSV